MSTIDDMDMTSKSISFKITDNKKILMLSGLSLCLMLLCYWDLWKWLISIWLNDHEYSHGVFIPFLTAYLVWAQREKFNHLKVAPSWIMGGSFLLFSSFLLVFGRSGGVVQSEALSVVIILPSLILLTFGRAFFKALLLPLFYFFFLIPWLDFLGPWMGGVVDHSNAPFQHLSAELGSFLLKLAGYPVFHDGIDIQLPSVTLRVAQECSGLRYITSIIAIGLPLVFFTQKTWPRALSILSSAIIITILSNALRIALAGIMGSHYGTEMLHGPSHILHGWLVSFIGWGGLFVINDIGRRIPASEKLHLHERWKLSAKSGRQSLNLQKAGIPVIGTSIFICGLLVYLTFFAMPSPVIIEPPLAHFLLNKEGWKGRNANWLEGDKYFPDLDDTISRVYTSSQGKRVYLFIGYYGHQYQGRSLITQFGKPLHKNSKGFDSPGRFTPNRSVLENRRQKIEIVFWYQLPGKKFRSRWKTKLFSALNALITGSNEGAVVIVGQIIDESIGLNENNVLLRSFMETFNEDFGRIF